jgi:muramidase (phage lysozyme)
MATYKVLSNKFSLGEKGKTVDSDALVGCNIVALVEAGHIAEVIAKVSKTVTSEQEK